MYGECLKCKHDVSDQMNWDTLNIEIECPNCGNKMTVDYDESYDEESNEVYEYWNLIQVERKKLPEPIQHLVDKMEEKRIKIAFGLVAQGHIPTIEKMIAEHSKVTEINTEGVDLSHSEYLWEKIGKEIGWMPHTAALYYIQYLRTKIQKENGNKEN